MLSSNFTKPLILIVDDIPANLHVLVSALRDSYRIKTATSGEMALKLAADKQTPDLILLDVMMPGMSGIEVMRHLRLQQRTRDIPVIFISADNSERTQLEGLELGADDYLIKPVSGLLLMARVRNLLIRKQSEKQLRLAAHVFESSGEAIMITDKDNCIVEVNPAFTRLTGYGLEELKGKNPRVLSAGDTPREVYQAMWQSIKEKGFWQGELWDKAKDGHVYPKYLTISVVRNSYHDVDFYIGCFTDVTERKETEEYITHLAHHDSLTGLLNRFSLQICMEQAIVTAKREQHNLAIMFIDMDRFKLINDTLGHNAGDALLIEVASRLRSNTRESDIVARWGGDEFVIVLIDVEDVSAAFTVAEKLLNSLRTPYTIGENTLHSTPSIGISLFPDHGRESDVLMKSADMAMYHAKNQGRDNFQLFSQAMNEAAIEKMELERDLRVGLDEGQLELYYQPQLNASDSCIVGFEALTRWRHPQRGLVSPAKFIPIAEETGLILALGEWVLNEACRQLAAWRNEGLPISRVAVNLSAQQLRLATLMMDVCQALEKNHLDGSDLELEITESVAMQDPESCIGQLQALRILGVRLSIDDFGTGYSSLSYLKCLPIHSLKLDQSFVRDIETDKNDVAICEATISLAHSLDLKIIAEGVENQAQFDFLVSHNCDCLQGYLISKPLPAIDVPEFIRQYPIKTGFRPS